MKTRQTMTKQMQSKIDGLSKAISDLNYFPIELIEQAFPEASITWWWDADIEITLPMRFSLIDEVKEFMTTQFPNAALYYDHQCVWDESKSAGYFVEYRLPTGVPHQSIPLKFGFRSGVEGSTCILNPIGEKTVPIFEVICQDGVKENTFD